MLRTRMDVMLERPHYSETALPELLAECQRERRSYSASGVDAAPACVELTRRTLAGDQQAWALFQTLFEPLMRAWIGVQQQVEPEDVLQEALFAFARWAPAHADLTAGVDLGRALAFLRQCTKTALLTQLRKAKQPAYIPIDQVAIETPYNAVEAAERRLVIQERMAHLLETDQERLIFREMLVNGRKPQDLFASYSTEFETIDGLRVAIQRVLRRLRKDEDLLALL